MIIKAFEYDYFKQLRKIRRNRIVFVNGCFDLLHAGHIRLIQNVKRWALNNSYQFVVGINSDESIKKLNKSHPGINNEQNRALTLKELGVDYVIIFDDETPTSLLMSLTPDAVYKGIEYKDKEYHEKEFLTKTSTVIFWDDDYIPGLSTTNIYNEIKDRIAKDILKTLNGDSKNETKI